MSPLLILLMVNNIICYCWRRGGRAKILSELGHLPMA